MEYRNGRRLSHGQPKRDAVALAPLESRHRKKKFAVLAGRHG